MGYSVFDCSLVIHKFDDMCWVIWKHIESVSFIDGLLDNRIEKPRAGVTFDE